MPDIAPLARSLTLPCGVRLTNRLAKAAMSEQLADRYHRPSDALIRLYDRWAAGGAGVLITGNVMVDRSAVSEPRQVVVDGSDAGGGLAPWAEAARRGGAEVWVQLNHGGRQIPRMLHRRPPAPSAVPVDGPPGFFGRPVEMSSRQVEDVAVRFADAASIVMAAGFTGIQVHAAHGYLLSQFLSPATNQRDDEWGGDPTRRRRLLGEVVRRVRAAIGGGAALSVKLNSSDFQRAGTDETEAAATAAWLGTLGVDLLEISGGSFEAPAMTGATPAPTDREAYFWRFAEDLRARTSMPIMLTGGFRTATAMAAAVESATIDVVGLARPLVLGPELPERILTDPSFDRATTAPDRPAWTNRTSMTAGLVDIAWHTEQLHRIARGERPEVTQRHGPAVARYLSRQLAQTVQARCTPRRR